MINIIGLGPGSKEYLTLEAYDTIKNAKTVYMRTKKHPVIEYISDLDVELIDYDYMYEDAEVFETVYEKIALDIMDKAMTEDVFYAVPGNPIVAETSVQRIIALGKEKNIDVNIIYGTSFIDAIITSMCMDPVKGLSIVDAMKIEDMNINPDIDSIIIQIYDKFIASQVKLKLIDYYGDDHTVYIVQGAGIPELENIVEIKLYELDRNEEYLDHLTSLYVPKAEEKVYSYFDLIKILKQLRGENGCPWDKKQTHESLIKCLLEESNEVIEAIENKDDENLTEELGDLLLQVGFHSILGEEEGYFNYIDVIQGVCEKMIRRHPHVFGDVEVNSLEEALETWNDVKKAEKEEKKK